MTRPSYLQMLLRGCLRRCPWCGGQGAFFTGWFAKQSCCRTCGLRWRRGDTGFELGAAAMAAVITLGPLILAMGVVLALTWPEVAVAPMLAMLIPTALLLPMIAYPLSYTVWQAVDILMRPVGPDDFDAAFIVDGALGDVVDGMPDGSATDDN